MKKKLVYRPTFKHVLVELIVEKPKQTSTLLMAEENSPQKFVKAKVIDYARDCHLFQSLTLGQDRFVIVQGHMIEEITFDEEVFHIVPENAIVMVSSEM